MNRSEMLFRSGQVATAWYVVRSGVFRGAVTTPEGEEYVTRFYYPGELMGVAGASGAYDETVTALSSATVCRIELGDVAKLLALDSGTGFLRLVAEHDRTHREIAINLRQVRAEARVAGFIRMLMVQTERQGFDPHYLHAPMSRTDFANHLGLTLECLSRVLGRWRRAGAIETSREHIRVLEPSMIASGLLRAA